MGAAHGLWGSRAPLPAGPSFPGAPGFLQARQEQGARLHLNPHPGPGTGNQSLPRASKVHTATTDPNKHTFSNLRARIHMYHSVRTLSPPNMQSCSETFLKLQA